MAACIPTMRVLLRTAKNSTQGSSKISSQMPSHFSGRQHTRDRSKGGYDVEKGHDGPAVFTNNSHSSGPDFMMNALASQNANRSSDPVLGTRTKYEYSSASS